MSNRRKYRSELIPSTSGSGYVLFHHVMGEYQGKRGVWDYKGGMGKMRCE